MRRSLSEWIRAALGALILAGGLGAAWAQPAENADRKIAPQDVLSIFIVGEKDLPTDFPVSSTGTIMFPYLDPVEVKDKTVGEVAASLREALGKDYFVDPQVLVSVKQYRKLYVRVIGQVMKPGLIELPGEQRMDVVDAIAAAGGLTNLADKDKLSLTRKGATRKLKLSKLKEITDQAKREWVEPDDILEAGQSVF